MHFGSYGSSSAGEGALTLAAATAPRRRGLLLSSSAAWRFTSFSWRWECPGTHRSLPTCRRNEKNDHHGEEVLHGGACHSVLFAGTNGFLSVRLHVDFLWLYVLEDGILQAMKHSQAPACSGVQNLTGVGVVSPLTMWDTVVKAPFLLESSVEITRVLVPWRRLATSATCLAANVPLIFKCLGTISSGIWAWWRRR